MNSYKAWTTSFTWTPPGCVMSSHRSSLTRSVLASYQILQTIFSKENIIDYPFLLTLIMRIDFISVFISHYASLWREEKLPWPQCRRCTSRTLGSPMRMFHNTYSSWNNSKSLSKLSRTESKCVVPICKSVISSFKTNLWFLSFKTKKVFTCTINIRYWYVESN